MKTIILFSLLIFCTLCQNYDTSLPVWPYPYNYTKYPNAQRYEIINWKDFQFLSNSQSTIINEALKRYKYLTFYDPSVPSSSCSSCVKGIVVQIDDPSGVIPSFEMDEQYTLTLDPKQEYFTIKSKQVWGSLRALETFSQMVQLEQQKYYIDKLPAEIVDKPRFKWRGRKR